MMINEQADRIKQWRMLGTGVSDVREQETMSEDKISFPVVPIEVLPAKGYSVEDFCIGLKEIWEHAGAQKDALEITLLSDPLR